MGEPRRGMKLKIVVAAMAIIVWFSFGYVGAAEYAGHFYGEFRSETKGHCARGGLVPFVGGPIGAFVEFSFSEHKPMWDWPKYLLEYEVPDAH